LKQRIGVITEAEMMGASLLSSGISLGLKVKNIKYVYKWKYPWTKVVNAEKRETPFYKQT
jgi:hypothetical protein